MTPSRAEKRIAVADATGALRALLTKPATTSSLAAPALAKAASAALGADVAVMTGDCLLAGPAPAGPGGQRVDCANATLRWCSPQQPSSAVTTLLRQGCAWLAAALAIDAVREQAQQAGEEMNALRDVVGQLLTVRDLDQVLLSIADRTLHLLESDICGVMLVDGDEVAMKSCVGNRAVETARLRMSRGQGVAGLVFLTGEPSKVDDYLADETISHDFMSLAEKEETLSALAVPLRLQGEFIGVLEVWRRRPSVFTDRDVQRMVTLADFVTITIDNARLNDRQANAVEQLKETRDALERQVSVLKRSSSLQQKLLATVLSGVGLPAIARTVATELDCRIGIYGPEGNLVAACGGRSLTSKLPSTAATRTTPGRHRVTLTDGSTATAWLQPIYADGDQVGSAAIIPAEHSAEMMDVIVGQVAMACSLTLLREHAASRARAEELEQLLWDLLQGSVEHRIAARTRAKQLNVALRGQLRVLYGRIDNLEEIAAESGWDTSQTDRVRREVLRRFRAVDTHHVVALSALRGNLITGIAVNVDRTAVKDLVGELATALRGDWPELRATWGASRAHEDVVDLPSALNEAKTALAAARRLGGENAFLYEELGIVRLLLGSGDDPDLQTFVDELTGPLVAYDRENNGALVRTLRAFFDANCSQRVAAERLFVHYKTLRYRLEQIKQLTGLDLARHEDRVRADFALRLLQVTRPLEDPEDAAAG
ncbi:GAF domain-containing protein [Amycolatopsis rubida]|uniref:GAF domain-containing protein n=1 Tax=Amycolatopsis rubida TaxID=112413 RepID=A0ABX0BLE4_9PSEU|nr:MULTISPECIES: helix-turn-helix domain-containing protein [Amycolatopsis]MYW89325.1 GAF domain-containing protein [Amycolatopsis rubida]NEC54303.1 GAF domain-containing protein [Amycolatopsis rubida]OAP21074.1 Purine catabolism regulatory protein [Amycolatopsis sp. M39]